MPVYPKKPDENRFPAKGFAAHTDEPPEGHLLRARHLPLFTQVPPFFDPPHIVGQGESDLVFDPLIIFSPKAAITQEALMRKTDTCGNLEIGWFAVADWNTDGNIYVSECHLPKQVGSSGLTTEYVGEFWDLMKKTGKADLLPRTNLWGHYHHAMSVNPSPQDDKGVRESFGIGTKEWTVRLIVNRRGEARADVYLWKRDLVICNCRCLVANPFLRAVSDEVLEVGKTWSNLVTFEHRGAMDEYDVPRAHGRFGRIGTSWGLSPECTDSQVVSMGALPPDLCFSSDGIVEGDEP